MTIPTRLMSVAVAVVLFSGCPSGNGSEEPLVELGEPCENHGECASALCLTSASEPVCGLACDDEESCPEGESCQLVAVNAADTAGDGPDGGVPEQEVVAACLSSPDGRGLFGDSCEGDEECGTGLCYEGTCNELCDDCGDDRSCESAVIERFGQPFDASVCHWDFGAPDISQGPILVGEDGSEEILLEIPDGLASFTIVVRYEQPEASRWVGILSLIGPDETVLMNGEDDVMDLNQGATNYPGATSVMVPSTDVENAFPRAGTYRLRIALFETDYVDFFPVEGEIDEVRVIFEHEGEEGGLLDVNLFFSPGLDITAEDAPESSFVRNLLGRVYSYYEPFGAFQYGEIRYGEIPEDYDTIESGEQARELCQSYSSPGPNRISVNIFLVSSISFSAGIAGGAPGPPGVYGTAASGIVIERQGNASQTGTVLAHELGHFLSLHHTTRVSTIDGERRIVGADGVSDTPRCEAGTQLEDCPDYRNLMFPYFPFDGLSMTEGQRWVISRSPLLYERNRPEICSLSTATYDMSGVGYGAGDTTAFADAFESSCGGGGAPDRVHLYRLETSGLLALDARVRTTGFAPILSIRRGSCDGEEVLCELAEEGTEITATIESPSPDWYYFVVDGQDGAGGFFSLDVTEVGLEE